VSAFCGKGSVPEQQQITTAIMGERLMTMVCTFDLKSPRISAFQVHEFIFETMGLTEDDICMIQIDGPRRRVFIKFVAEQKLEATLRETGGALTYRHVEGEQSQVLVERAGMGMRDVRIANLPPEVQNRAVSEALTCYGETMEIKDEMWTNAYRYKISNGIRQVKLNLKKHLPSRLTIAGYTVEVTYPGQPATCYACHEPGHVFAVCPHRRRGTPRVGGQGKHTWADVVAEKTNEKTTDEMATCDEHRQSTQGRGQDDDTLQDRRKENGTSKDNSSLLGSKDKDTEVDHVGPPCTSTETPVSPMVPGVESKGPQVPIPGTCDEDRSDKSPPPPIISTDSRIGAPAIHQPSPSLPRTDDPQQSGDVDMSQLDPDAILVSQPTSPKRIKKTATGKEYGKSRERTRSRTRFSAFQ